MIKMHFQKTSLQTALHPCPYLQFAQKLTNFSTTSKCKKIKHLDQAIFHPDGLLINHHLTTTGDATHSSMKRDIAKLVADGFYKEAISSYTQLHSAASFRPNKFTFPPLLKACGKLKSLPQGQMLHTHLIKTGFHGDIYTSTALTAMYMKFHLFDDAIKVFDAMPERSLPLMNSLISGFSQSGCCTEAFWVFREVGNEKFRPNSITIASVLSACEGVGHGLQLHCWAVRLGAESDVYVATSLVTMYSNFAEILSATKVFEQTLNKNVVSYNAFISGLLQNGVPRVVLYVFNDMRKLLDEEPNSVTLISVLSACSNLKNLRFGRQVHGLAEKLMLRFDTMVGTALVDMYCKCGCWQLAYDIFKELGGNKNLITWNSMLAGMMLNGECENASEIFDQLESKGLEPDSATWNSMISGFSQLGKGGEAIKFFNKMQLAGVAPSLKSVTSLLGACSDLSAIQFGKEIHGHAIRNGIDTDDFMVSALIDMYMKCGHSSLARIFFDQLEIKPNDPAIWNALITGYGRNGEDESAFEIFYMMLEERVQPNSATFSSMLSVCSHTGQVDKGWQIFKMINRDHGLNPTAENYGCMIDLLGRSGHLEEAEQLIQEMTQPPASVYASLLGACKCHSNSELGEEMAKKLSELEPENSAPYVDLSNIYAAQGRWGDVEMVRERMDVREVRKRPGHTLIGVA